MTIWVGAGLGGLVVLISGELPPTAGGGSVRPILIAAALTAALICVGCLAMARVGFEWAATQLKRLLEADQSADGKTLTGDDWNWPALPEFMWRASLILFIAASTAFLVAIWWSI
jgi:hypothetical protein